MTSQKLQMRIPAESASALLVSRGAFPDRSHDGRLWLEVSRCCEPKGHIVIAQRFDKPIEPPYRYATPIGIEVPPAIAPFFVIAEVWHAEPMKLEDGCWRIRAENVDPVHSHIFTAYLVCELLPLEDS